ncbi:hypothetical protein G7Y89_g7115 [Cudoniella acicularis]|uniref:Sialidase domain-containing protein n=1 Tax=Cudoniella acicularis TaxID=354080 RepID=A0A8H4RKQ4_9HELO|nr:hypothetical protein G7Y89_g7115 [Cudoniella acicularis]
MLTVSPNNKKMEEFACSSDLCHMGHGTYPRATRLNDGSLLGTHTALQNGENVIVTTRSTDEGLNWRGFGEVIRGVGDIDNPFVIQLQNGIVLCAFRNHSKNSDGGYVHFRITICVSEDGGRCWKYLSTAEESSHSEKGLWEPFMRLAKDGSLQLYYSRENGCHDQDSIQRISHDGGATWGEVIAFSGYGIIARDGMLGLVEFGNQLVAVFETDEEGPMHIKSVISPDDGKTWAHRQLIYRAPRGVAAAPQIANCGGVLIAGTLGE